MVPFPRAGFRALKLLLAAAALAGCATLPPNENRAASRALEPAAGTRLDAAVAPLVASRPGLSGFHPLTEGSDAFAARIILAGAAERSIDAQYYIWHGDQTGVMAFEALWNAARRGVRVRLLVDDQNTKGTEEILAAMSAETNLEVRLYNPFANRDARALGYFGDFARLNRRMHNKSLVADNRVAIVGGRNIGNEYFGAGDAIPFKDLDVVAIGPVVRDVSAQFDVYWNSASAYPAQSLLGPPPQGAAQALAQRFAATRDDAPSRAYIEKLRATPLLARLLDRTLAIEWAEARVLHDAPRRRSSRNAPTSSSWRASSAARAGRNIRWT
jgi:putative cardiolipin synthase